MKRCVAAGLVLALGCLVPPRAARAQSYEISWQTVDGGGAMDGVGGRFGLGGSIGQPDAGGPFVGGAFLLRGGFWALIGSDTAGAEADLAVTKSDGQTTAIAGETVSYAIVVSNAGPDAVSGASVVDVPPASLTGVVWTCSASPGSSCPASGSGQILHTVDLAPAGTLSYSLTALIDAGATGTLVNTATVTAPAGVLDPALGNNSATDSDVLLPGSGVPAEGELSHGSELVADLASVAGLPDEDLFRIHQRPHASYEVLVDGTSGDIGTGQGPALDRLAPDASSIVQASTAAGAGGSRSLRWMNVTGVSVDAEYVRVRSQGCTSSCDSADLYRIRAYETTYTNPRFNNSATQVTVVVLQNTTPLPISGRLVFWSVGGQPLAEQPFDLAARAVFTMNTAGLPALAGQAGSMTVSHDAPYGTLAGKAVAVEPATGFTFDTPFVPRPLR